MKLKDLLKGNNFTVIDYDDYEKFKDQYSLNEGLIKTWPLNKSVKIIKTNGFDVESFESQHIFKVLIDKNDPFDKLISITNNLGWFPSYIWYLSGGTFKDREKYDRDKIDDIRKNIGKFEFTLIQFEAKYDISVSNIPKYLYHVTAEEKFKNISSKGLVPKSNGKLAAHPPRIYLGTNADDLERMVLQRPNAFGDTLTGRFVILRINTDMIGDYFQIFTDPNAKKFGYFTLNNIQPRAIEKCHTFDLR